MQQKNSNASTVVAHNAPNTVSLAMKQNCVKTLKNQYFEIEIFCLKFSMRFLTSPGV